MKVVIVIKKHLFLTGPSGCGKTTMIRKALGDNLMYAGGFITERALDESGKVLGYDLLPAAAAGGVQGFEQLRFLDYTVEPPKNDNEIFRNQGAELLKEAEFYPFSLIDEFGGFELVIPQFRKALEDFLNMDQPIIGVIKDFKNADELRQHIGLGERYMLLLDNLHKVLAADPDTQIVRVHGRNDILAMKKVQKWAEEYGHA